MVFLYFICFPIFFYVLTFFNKKLIVLLMLEANIILCIFFIFSFFSSIQIPFSFLMCLVLFMVLESVFGLSVLISVSRNSSFYNSNLVCL